ncbi:Crp/Fnr family transcriptional regulator [Acuticoccus sediminis]|nr:cyclic nucleotide-binding domain-containing protein [Acuticoccus sediminis]
MLKPLGDEALKLLAFGSLPRSFKPRQALFDAGDDAEGAVLILGGQVRLVPGSHAGPPKVVGVGYLLDELALIIPMQRSVSAVAQTSCEILALPREQMLRILEEYPDAAQHLRAQLVRRTMSLIDDVNALRDRFGNPPSRD